MSHSPTAVSSIPPSLFAEAIHDLPLDALYGKVHELQNSMMHLLNSNTQMAEFAASGDTICREAIAENQQVLARMQERVVLCRQEVERRGLVWTGHGAGDPEPITNGQRREPENGISEPGNASGTLSDEELRRRLEAQLGRDEGEDDEEGVHL